MRHGGIVQYLLLGLFTAFGALATLAVAVDWFQGLDTWSWEEASCTIESSAAAAQPEYGEYRLELFYRYSFRGRDYVGEAYRHGGQGFVRRSEAEMLASRYPPGGVVGCWVDPDQPERSYLRRADLWQGLWILVPMLFVAVGVGGIWLVRRLTAGRGSTESVPGEPGEQNGRPLGKDVGRKVLVAFFAIFLLFGAGFLVPFFIHPALEVLAARSWDEVSCEVLSSQVRTHPGEDGDTYSIDVLYRYEVGGREYRSNRYEFMGGSSSGHERRAAIVDRLPAGARAVCYVDPSDPFAAVMERGFTADYLFGLVPLVFVLVGLGGLVFALGFLRGARREAAATSWSAVAGFGSAEAGGAAASRGPMALEPALGPFGKLGCAVLFALGWNGFISIFVWHVARDWQAGNPQWFAALVLAPFVLIGVLLLAAIPYSILALLNPRPRLRLTPGVLAAGGAAQLEWAFHGAGSRVRHLEIWLEAVETRTRSTASGFRVETSLLDTPAIRVLDRGGELPVEYGSVSFTVPAGTPPSSAGEPTVRWRLKLRGSIDYWPDVAAEYEVEILPPDPARLRDGA